MSEHRPLKPDEIKKLENNGCRSADWAKVLVVPSFRTDNLRDATFSGNIALGLFSSPGSGIQRARLQNCVVGDEATVRDVAELVDNYEIGNGAEICATRSMRAPLDCTFGNGTTVAVLIESGGRDVILHAGLTAQEAYLQAFCRQPQEVRTALKTIAVNEAKKLRGGRGFVGAGAKVNGCGAVLGSSFGKNARAEGCLRIENSTVNGRAGEGSAIRDSIIAQGGEVGLGCLVERCFVACAARLGEGFHAENSLFFANCECLRGEACAVFSGPHTVSHHKATLLLAAIYSFYNAGSGANFSNHRYKLGPLHSGIFERGGKNGSGSYLLWPGRIGAFTSVIGRHHLTLDTSELPFSLLLQQGERSILLPGANLFSAGLERDFSKWPERDRRTPASPDLISYPGLSPYTCAQILRAIELLKALRQANGRGDGIDYKGAHIPGPYVEKALARYHAAANLYFGSVLAKNLENGSPADGHNATFAGAEAWSDYAGLLAPVDQMNELLQTVASGVGKKQSGHSTLVEGLGRLQERYGEYEWDWLCARLGAREGGKIAQASAVRTLESWREAARLRLELVARDAKKEYAPEMQTGFGLCGEMDAEFREVRGEYDGSAFAVKIKAEAEEIAGRVERLLGFFK